MAQKIFDAHFHLLFKHFITGANNIGHNIRVTGLAQVMDGVFGGLFDSQASPQQMAKSNVRVAVTGMMAVEHAFANRLLHVGGFDLSGLLKVLDKELFRETREGRRVYYDEYLRQVRYYLHFEKELKSVYNIHYLRRGDAQWQGKGHAAITAILNGSEGDHCYLAFSIEGGHNLSNVPIRGTAGSRNPELQLRDIQDNDEMDIMSINLCHLSHIPEQTLGGFAQGLNRTAQIAFSSDDFIPKSVTGLTELGKKVVRQALTHPRKPVLIDVKHMSAYTRLHFYRFRERLIEEQRLQARADKNGDSPGEELFADISKLPILCSHTGFTFISLEEYIREKPFVTEKVESGGVSVLKVKSRNRAIGDTNDKRFRELWANPWTIGLFDEEIIQIMESGGLIGISMDQRVLGAAKTFDAKRGEFYEDEYMPREEGGKLFIEGVYPAAEGIVEKIFGAPDRAERHIMLFCAHLVYAARLGRGWVDDPWDHLCMGSDFDGLINPLNDYDNVVDLSKLPDDLRKYLPVADRTLSAGAQNDRALNYNSDGSVDKLYLEEVIRKVLFDNGVRLTASYLRNWDMD